MPVPADLFGTHYLDAESFRNMAELFGAGVSMCDYPNTTDGNAKLLRVLKAASRAIDSFTARDYSPDDKTETHRLDLSTWRFSVNNPPVVTVSSCRIYYAIDGYLQIDPSKLFINNQKGYIEITRLLEGSLHQLEVTGTEIAGPQVIVIYKSLQSIPKNVQLACGFQAGHLINSGFADKMLPPNMGKLDLGGLSINNKKHYGSAEANQAASFSRDAERLLIQEIKISIA